MWLSGISWHTTVATTDTAMCVCVSVCLWAAELFIKHLQLTLRHLHISPSPSPTCTLSLSLRLLLFSSAFHFPFWFSVFIFIFLFWFQIRESCCQLTLALLIAVSLCQLPAAFINDTRPCWLITNAIVARPQLQLQLVCDAMRSKRKPKRDETRRQGHEPI